MRVSWVLEHETLEHLDGLIALGSEGGHSSRLEVGKAGEGARQGVSQGVSQRVRIAWDEYWYGTATYLLVLYALELDQGSNSGKNCSLWRGARGFVVTERGNERARKEYMSTYNNSILQ